MWYNVRKIFNRLRKKIIMHQDKISHQITAAENKTFLPHFYKAKGVAKEMSK